jgi:hypothetical protein
MLPDQNHALFTGALSNTPMHVSIILFAIGLLDRNVAGMPLSLAPQAKAA